MHTPKTILVFTNNPISLSNSNGRSMYNLLRSSSEFKIVNLFVHDGEPSLENISYLRVSDKNVFDAFLKNKDIPLISYVQNNNNLKPIKNRSIKKTSFKMLVRGFLWSRKRATTKILKLAETIKPDILIYQVGDSYFFNNLASSVKQHLNIPMIIYDTEDYYFKKWDFIKSRFFRGALFRLYKRKYNLSFEKLVSNTEKAVFLTEDLEVLHSDVFPKLSTAHIYNSYSTIPNEAKTPSPTIVYSGNLDVGRIDSLIGISKILQHIDHNLKLTICSQTNNKSIFSKMEQQENIVFLGNISYEENLKLIKSAHLIVHVESFAPFYVKDTEHAFSTKIPDCLATLNPLLVFAPNSCSISKYLKKYECGWVCDNLSDLEENLKEIINSSFSNKYSSNAVSVLNKNHDPHSNSLEMNRIIKELI